MRGLVEKVHLAQSFEQTAIAIALETGSGEPCCTERGLETFNKADVRNKLFKASRKSSRRGVALGYDFKHIEEQVGKHWQQHQKEIDVLLKYNPEKKLYSWLEGPPTANAPPALHHVEVRVFKDVVLRFKTMQGYSVPRKGGWDCHGLPVEVQVEKKLKLKSKKDVITYGVPKFIEACKKDVFTFVKDWNDNTKKLGFWVDLPDAYMTLATPYMESVWWSLKELFNKKLLYEGYKVVPYCPRCETPLSSHEVALGYQDIEEKTVVVTFSLKDKLPGMPKEKVQLLVWTTTPWTLPANASIAVHKDIPYALISSHGTYYVLAEELVSKYFKHAETIQVFPGADLVGKHYEPLFPYFTLKKGFFIMDADYVTVSEGTGLVHQASAYGEVDYDANQKAGVGFIHPVLKDGTFSDEITDFKGIFVKDADPLIIAKLDKDGKLFKILEYVHSYPFCWRCKSPLLYYAMDTWFVKVSEFRQQLLAKNQEIHWYPDSVKDGRFGNWLEGAKDWALSRNKFWGTPLPIWICNVCKHQEAIGSIKELEEKTGAKHITDLHIMSVDTLTMPCPACEKKGKHTTMRRTPEVIDCWYDSGSAAFAQFHYPFENKELFEKRFPYDFIVEAIDQTRGWFYTLHVLGVLLFDQPAYRNVAVGGLLCDDNGEKMSKSKGNIVSPEETFTQYGVDAVRLAMCSYPLGNQIRYGPSVFKDTLMPYFNTLWNCFIFVQNYFKNNGLDGKMQSDLQQEDLWILSKTNTLISTVTEDLEKHEYSHAIVTIMSFVIDDFSRGYIKMIRERTATANSAAAFSLRYVLERVILITAPFTPYLAEWLYQDFMKEGGMPWSVHVLSWPSKEDDRILPDMERHMRHVQVLITGILGAREKAQLGVRWPISKAIIDLHDNDVPIKDAYAAFTDMVHQQTNVKEILFEKFTELDYDFKPNYDALGRALGEHTADVLTALPAQKGRILSELRQGKEEFLIAGQLIKKEHLLITKIPPTHLVYADFTECSTLYLETTTNDALLAEGYARELTRRIQEARKELGLKKTDTLASVAIIGEDLGLAPFFEEIKKKVGAKQISATPLPHKDFAKVFTIKQKTFTINVQK
ncbi:MAG: isoleucine--tRNA ligase [archaeon]